MMIHAGYRLQPSSAIGSLPTDVQGPCDHNIVEAASRPVHSNNKKKGEIAGPSHVQQSLAPTASRTQSCGEMGLQLTAFF